MYFHLLVNKDFIIIIIPRISSDKSRKYDFRPQNSFFKAYRTAANFSYS